MEFSDLVNAEIEKRKLKSQAISSTTDAIIPGFIIRIRKFVPSCLCMAGLVPMPLGYICPNCGQPGIDENIDNLGL